MGIFSTNCDFYWEKGLPVIPLLNKHKRPAINNWQTYANQMPSEREQAIWKEHYGDGNIGLPLGPKSGLIAIDIDTEDPRAEGVFDRVLPPSPWVRVGRKGRVQIYKYDGQRTIRIKDAQGASLVEMLSAGTQVVLPPSIHPDTQQPYTANGNLYEMLDQILRLPPDIEVLLREGFKMAGIQLGTAGIGALTSFVSPGSRDNTLMSAAGLFSSDICRGHKTLLEACEQIEVWTETYTKKVYGDTIDPKKGPKKIVECLIKDVTGPKHKVLPKGWDDGLTDQQKTEMGLDIFSKDHETWNYEQIKDYFDAGLEKSGVKDNQELFLGLARDVVLKIAANQGLDNLEEGRLLRYICDISGRKVPVSEMRKMIVEYRSGEIKGNDHTELAKAVKKDLEERHNGSEIRYHNDRLWIWSGSHWIILDDMDVLKHIADEYGSFRAGSRANDHRGVLQILKSISKRELKNLAEVGINFVNGFLDEDLKLKPHNRDHGMTYCLEYPYLADQAGKCVKWLEMLHDYWGTDPDYSDKVNSLGEAMAVTMFGKATSCQRAYCLYGVSHSGKSRILEIMQALMPPEAQTTMPPTMWGDKFGAAPLADKLLNFAGELSEHNLIDSVKFKQIVCGETIDGQFKNQQLFSFTPKAAHWFSTNHLPRTRDSSDGFTRRWQFFQFNKKFPIERKKIDYDREVVAEERTAIAAWVVQHIVRLKNENWTLTDPPSSQFLREYLENELNTVRAFLSDLQDQKRMRLGVEENEGIQNPVTTFETLWTEYRSYCVNAGVSPVGSKVFGKRLNLLQAIFGYTEEKTLNGQGYQIKQYKYVTLATQH